MSRRLGIISVTNTLLAHALKLPPDTVILRAKDGEWGAEVTELLVESPELPEVGEGCNVPKYSPRYQEIGFNWNL